MDFLSWLFSLSKPPELPKVTTILPDVAKNEIESERLPDSPDRHSIHSEGRKDTLYR